MKHARMIAQTAKFEEKCLFQFTSSQILRRKLKKGGLHTSEEIFALARQITSNYKELSLQGIMAIPPIDYAKNNDDQTEARAHYQELRILAEQVGEGKLSLGMSQDLELAITSGSDIIRVGEALLGKRPPKPSK